jgi:hypothetical protein
MREKQVQQPQLSVFLRAPANVSTVQASRCAPPSAEAGAPAILQARMGKCEQRPCQTSRACTRTACSIRHSSTVWRRSDGCAPIRRP